MGLLVNVALIKCIMKYVFPNLPQYALQIFRSLLFAKPCKVKGKSKCLWQFWQYVWTWALWTHKGNPILTSGRDSSLFWVGKQTVFLVCLLLISVEWRQQRWVEMRSVSRMGTNVMWCQLQGYFRNVILTPWLLWLWWLLRVSEHFISQTYTEVKWDQFKYADSPSQVPVNGPSCCEPQIRN